MHKFTRNGINSPYSLKYYIVHEMFNICLENSDDSGLHPTTQKELLALIDGNQDFW